MNRSIRCVRLDARQRFHLAAGLLLLVAEPCRAELPQPMAATWRLFQAAVRANDPAAMARISHFPVESNEFGGDIPDAVRLRERFARIFPDGRRACLLNQTPTPLRLGDRPTYEVFCDNDRVPIRFLFEPVGADYRWTVLDNINE